VPGPPALPSHARRWLYGSFFLGLAGVVVAASKPGAGSYHLLPFWPTVIYAIALHGRALVQRFRAGTDPILGPALLAFGVVMALIAFLQQTYFITMTKQMDDADVVADLRHVIDHNPGRIIAMGYNNAGDRFTFFRPLLVFQNSRYLIDAPAVQEYEMSGIDLPPATLRAVRRCENDIWLIPSIAKPFDGPNKYPMLEYRQLFSDAFKQAFFETYVHSGDTRYFQIWSCRRDAR
jgi:hypothetical protein